MAAQGSRQNGILMFRVEIHSPCSSHSCRDTTAIYGDVFTVVNSCWCVFIGYMEWNKPI